MPKVTLSVIKADVGSYVGHSCVHPDLMETAKQYLAGKGRQLIIDYLVTHVGDDLVLILTHDKGTDNEEIHKLAWDTFMQSYPYRQGTQTVRRRTGFAVRFVFRQHQGDGTRDSRDGI